MLQSDSNPASVTYDKDVDAIVASLNGMRAETGAGGISKQGVGVDRSSPVILQRRASAGLESRMSNSQNPQRSENGDVQRVIEQRLDRLDARLDSISRSVEFSEAYLSLKLKQQLQEIVGIPTAAQAGGRTSSANRGWLNAFLLIFATGAAALLVAEVHSDFASRSAERTLNWAAPLLDLAAQRWLG